MDAISIRLPDGTIRTARPSQGQTLAQAIFLLGLWNDTPLCSGLGKCGLCRVRFLADAPPPRREEKQRLGKKDVDNGWRLACLHPAAPARIELPPSPRGAAPRMQGQSRPNVPIRLAVDLGTTSLHWSALQNGEETASGSELNAQIGLGGEIMARLAFTQTPDGGRELRELALGQLKHLAALLNTPLEELCVAANPAMLALLLGRDPSGLMAAPYRSPLSGGMWKELDPALPPAYIPPVYAPFVGADLSAGLAALVLAPNAQPDYPFLLADLGTNGEFILALSPREALCASVPMGPALEGVGLRHGRTAGPGAVTGFTLTPRGVTPTYFKSRRQGIPGITGTGHLSLAALLRRNGLLTTEGLFTPQADPAAPPLQHILRKSLDTLQGEPVFQLPDGLHLPGSDIEEMLKVKAAFNLAFSRLLKEAGLQSSQLKAIHLGGAMGEHVAPGDLETLGFVPTGAAEKIRSQGNTSLRGARLLLQSPETRSALEALPHPALVDLAADPELGQQFMQRMVFDHVR